MFNVISKNKNNILNKNLILFTTIIGYNNNFAKIKENTNFQEAKFNKIVLTYKKENFQLSDLNNDIALTSKLNFNFGNQKVELWPMFLFSVTKQFRLFIVDLINEDNSQLKKDFNSLDIIEIFTVLINIMTNKDFFKSEFSEKEQKIIEENTKYLIVEFFKNTVIEEKMLKSLLSRINKIMEIILKNIPNKIKIDININGKNISQDVIKKLFTNKKVIELFSTMYLLFLDNMRQFYITKIIALKDEELLEMIKKNKNQKIGNGNTNDNQKKEPAKKNSNIEDIETDDDEI
jgi:hypothetical protein